MFTNHVYFKTMNSASTKVNYSYKEQQKKRNYQK